MASRNRLLINFFVALISFRVSSGRFLDNVRSHTVREANVLSIRSLEEKNLTCVENASGIGIIVRVDGFEAEKNDGDHTKMFERAWEEACSSKAPIILVVPQNTYLLKPIRFSGPCQSNNIIVQIQGIIEASVDRSDYNDRHWLLFDGVRHLTVEGGGTLNGNGHVWWRQSCKVNKALPCREAPTALTFHNCEDLVVRNLRVRDAQQMHVAFHHCDRVGASHLAVTAPSNSPNTDGIHVTHTRYINISDSVIGTGDDCISIVSGSSAVRASSITCGPGHGISIGSLGNGNSEAYVSDVIVDGAKLSGTTNGLRIKTWQGGSGSASNIEFSNIELHDVKNPIIIDQNYCDQKNPCTQKIIIPCHDEQNSAVRVSNVSYRNITGTSASDVAIRFECSKRFACRLIMLQDVDILRHGGSYAKALCDNVEVTGVGFVTPLCQNAVSDVTAKSSIQPSAKQRVHIVDDVRAQGNIVDHTEAFKKAWEEACSSNVRTILVVPQRSYLVKPIKFEGPCKSNVTFKIYGTIKASDERSDYTDRHWIKFDQVNGLTVEGGGTIDGNGQVWWNHSCKVDKTQPCRPAPTALMFNKCENLRVRNVTIRNAQQMQVIFHACKYVKAQNLTVTAPGNSPNTDGIHVSHSNDIHISNCIIGTGDDCISIVSGSKRVHANDIICGPGHGISIGSLGANKSEAHVSDVTINRAKFLGSSNGVRIKTWQGGWGNASNIKFVDIEMHDVRNPIIINQNYCDQKTPCKQEKSAVQVANVLYENIRGTSSSEVAVTFNCSESRMCEGVVMKSVDLRDATGYAARALCNNIHLFHAGLVSPPCPN